MDTTRTIETRHATPGDTEVIGQVLAQAFQEDPVLTWVVPGPGRRRDRLPALFRAFAAAFVPHGWSRLADPGAGVSLAAPAGVDPISGDALEEFGQRLADVLGDDAERAGHLDALLKAHHPAEPCAYLQFLGVVPERQGHGVGSRLLAELLDPCDERGVPAYLEATSPVNRRLYERHGFTATGELALPDGPPLWPMWRNPRG